MNCIVTALALGLASGFSSYERKEGCPELYSRPVLLLEFNPAFLHVDGYADGQALTIRCSLTGSIRSRPWQARARAASRPGRPRRSTRAARRRRTPPRAPALLLVATKL